MANFDTVDLHNSTANTPTDGGYLRVMAMRTYFALKLILVLITIIIWGRLAGTGIELLIAVLIGIDFTIVPICYLIYRLFHRGRIAPGEYKVKPKGRQL
ncbi:MAG: hypothetical protein WD469_06140 [Paenibacillaceae bacterium]